MNCIISSLIIELPIVIYKFAPKEYRTMTTIVVINLMGCIHFFKFLGNISSLWSQLMYKVPSKVVTTKIFTINIHCLEIVMSNSINII